jgi:hypothetical protein
MFPPGRARLFTRPYSTGLLPIEKTMGMVAVADLAARTAEVVPTVTMTSTRCRTKSSAKAGKRP